MNARTTHADHSLRRIPACVLLNLLRQHYPRMAVLLDETIEGLAERAATQSEASSDFDMTLDEAAFFHHYREAA